MDKELQRREVVRLDNGDQTYFTSEGYLIDHPIVTRTGIFEYRARDGTVRREYRPPEEVFDPESLESYAGKPVIITHDAGTINTGNVADEEIGTILEAGYRDGDSVRAKIVIHDVDAMRDSGLKELSLGYSLHLEDAPGEIDGQQYDAVQRHIRINHLALVAEARAGDKARLNIDGKDSSDEKGDESVKKKDAEAVAGKAAEEAAQATAENPEKEIAKEAADIAGDTAAEEEQPGSKTEEVKAEPDGDVLAQIRANVDRRRDQDVPENLEAAHDLIAAQESDIGKLLDYIDGLQAKADMACTKTDADEPQGPSTQEDLNPEKKADAECESKADADAGAEAAGDKVPEKKEEPEEEVNADSVERRVAEMVSVLRVGDRLHMDGLDRLHSTLEMKKEIIRKLNPKINFDGKSKAYINAAYDFAVENLIPERKDADYQRAQMRGTAAVNHDSKDAGLTMAQAAWKRSFEREGGKK